MTLEHPNRFIAFIAISTLPLCGILTAQTPQPAPKQSTPPATVKGAAPKPKIAPPPQLQLEPKALDILKDASGRLAAAHTLSFTAVETFESLSRQGAPLVLANKYQVTLERPNKLRVVIAGDGPASEF